MSALLHRLPGRRGEANRAAGCTIDLSPDPAGAAVPAPPTASPDAWGTADEANRERARARLVAVSRSDVLHAAGVPRGEADRVAAEESGVSPQAVAGWRRRVAGLPAGGRVTALLDRPGRGRRAALDLAPEMAETVEALLTAGGKHCTASHARRVLAARFGEGATIPTISAIARWMRRFRAERARELSAVQRPDHHRGARMPAFGRGGGDAFALNALWELDSTPADVICADPLTGEFRRYAIVGCIDVFSRRAMVLVTPTSRAVAIAALLRRCLLEWGVPLAVKTDRGKDYISQHVTRVLADLEIKHDICPPYTPEAKPYIERFFGTLTRDLFAHLPGFTGHNVAEAQALRERDAFAARRGKKKGKKAGAGKSGERAAFELHLTADELQRRCDLWLSSEYEARGHRGLDGESPRQRAASWTGEVRWIETPRALDALLAPAAGQSGTRVVGKKGISVGGIRYIAAELWPHIKERVRIREDATDPGRFHVYRMDGRFLCVAEDPGRTGLNVRQTALEAKALAKRHDQAARAHARALLRRRRPEAAMDEVLAHGEAEASKIVLLPRAGTAHETPALEQAARAAEAAESAARAADPTTPPRGGRALAAAAKLYLEDET